MLDATCPTVACSPAALATPSASRRPRGIALPKPTRAEISAAVHAFSGGGLSLIAEIEGAEQVARVMHTTMPSWPR